MRRKQCSLGLMVRGEEKASHPPQTGLYEQDFGGPFSSVTISAQWVPQVCIKHLPECHTSSALLPLRWPCFNSSPPTLLHGGLGLWAAQTDKAVNLNALLNLLGNKGVVQVTALKNTSQSHHFAEWQYMHCSFRSI